MIALDIRVLLYSQNPNSVSSCTMEAEIEGGETLTCSAALAIEPASPTATKYSSCLKVKRSGMRSQSPLAVNRTGPDELITDGLHNARQSHSIAYRPFEL